MFSVPTRPRKKAVGMICASILSSVLALQVGYQPPEAAINPGDYASCGHTSFVSFVDCWVHQLLGEMPKRLSVPRALTEPIRSKTLRVRRVP